jgi:hypothetical protein
MAYVRGAKEDFDTWEREFGAEGWGWDKMLEAYMKSEDFLSPDSAAIVDKAVHGTGGPLGISVTEGFSEVSHAFVAGAEQLGFTKGDYNNGTMDGVCSLFQQTIRKGARSDTNTAFIASQPDKPNLTIITSAQAARILLEDDPDPDQGGGGGGSGGGGKKAVGVEVIDISDGTHARVSILARKEVIVSCGAIQVPTHAFCTTALCLNLPPATPGWFPVSWVLPCVPLGGTLCPLSRGPPTVHVPDMSPIAPPPQSPHVLMLSGIGPRAELERAGIDCQVELPGVGQGLEDHIANLIRFGANTASSGPGAGKRLAGLATTAAAEGLPAALPSLARWAMFGTGLHASPSYDATLFYKTAPFKASHPGFGPDVQVGDGASWGTAIVGRLRLLGDCDCWGDSGDHRPLTAHAGDSSRHLFARPTH